jgi:hypothetical protein
MGSMCEKQFPRILTPAAPYEGGKENRTPSPGPATVTGFRARNFQIVASLLLALLVAPCTSFAHRLDEYLQATLVVIEPEGIRLQINLTPGVEVVEKVLALFDPNKDGVISTKQGAAYAELLKRDLAAKLDGRKLEIQVISSSFPSLAELRAGTGVIQMEFLAKTAPLASGSHKFTMENRHLPKLSVFLFNAARPSNDSISITQQKRNKNQSKGEINFELKP